MLRLGWFSTGRGEGSRGFLNLVQRQIDAGDLDARIQYVFSNREPGEAEGSDQFFKLVEGYGLPLVTLSSQRFRREHGGGPISAHRVPFHRAAMDLIAEHETDVVVLAGYMLITSPEMCRRHTMINLHPALPDGPAGTWQQVIWKLIEEGAGESGVMVHLATEVLDAGPVLAYCRFPIRGGGFDPLWAQVEARTTEWLKAQGEEQPLFKEIRRQGMIREGPLLLEAIRKLADGGVRISDGPVVDGEGVNTPGLCLDDEVARFLSSRGGQIE